MTHPPPSAPSQAISPQIKLFSRTAPKTFDVFQNSTRVVRAGMDGFLANVCPCNVQYRYLLVVYEYHTWKQVYMKSNVAPRYFFIYVYIFYLYLCTSICISIYIYMCIYIHLYVYLFISRHL